MRILDRILSRTPSAGRNRRDRGLTLIETSVVLGILAVVVVYLGTMLADSSERIRAKAASDRLAEVHDAAQAYIKANYSKLVAVAPSSPNALVVPVTGTAGPAGVSGGKSLQEGGFLAASFNNVNSYNQTHAVLVRKLGGNGLEALVTTNGGQVIPDAQLGRIASFRGAAGGFMASRPLSSADNGVVTGAYGGWRTAADTWGSVNRPTVGHLASTLAFEDGGMIADYLYRNDIGIPEANRMNTAIDMNRNNINNAETVNAQNVIAELDLWAKRDVKAGRNVLADGSVIAQGNVSAAGNVSAGKDLGVSGNAGILGNLNVRGTGTVEGDLGTNSDLHAKGGATIGEDLNVGRNSLVQGNSDVVGEFKTAQGVAFSTDLKATPWARSIAGIDIDLLVFNSQGSLTKGNGIRLRDLLPRQVAQYSYVVSENTLVPKPTCVGGGGNARIMIYRQTDSQRAPVSGSASGSYMGSVIVNGTTAEAVESVFASDVGNFWRVNWSGNAASTAAARRAIAQSFCYYGPQ